MNLRKWRQHDRGASAPDPQTSPTITDALSREPPDDGPGQGFASGLRWSAGNVVVGRALSMVSTIVLARILAPEVFGIFAVTLVVLTGLISVNDFGTTNAIVRWPGSPDRAARTATTLAWTGSTLACGLAVIAAPVIASWSHAPSARLPMQILALGVLVDGIAAVPGAMLTRNFQQKRRTTADFASLIASVGLSIGLALAGAGIWALVLGRLIGNVMGTIAVVVVAPSRPRPGWNRDDARTLLHFGLPLVGASALVFVMANLDTIVIARGLGAGAALGFYALAFNLSSWPLNVLSGMLRRVSLPLFASHQHNDEQLTSSVLGTVQLVGAVAALPAMLLGALALITGGVLGNLYDRLGLPGLAWHFPPERRGQPVLAVRDWIHFSLEGVIDWPIFNLADSWLVVGAGLLVLLSLRAPSSGPVEPST